MSEYLKLQNAVLSDNIQVLKQALEEVKNVNETGGSGINICHYYISMTKKLSMNTKEVVDVLISKGVDINAQNEKGATPLHYCVAHSNPEIAENLITEGAKVDVKDDMGNTPLWRAVMNFRGEEKLLAVIKELIKGGADPDLENNSGYSPRSIVISRHESMSRTKKPKEWDLQTHLNW